MLCFTLFLYTLIQAQQPHTILVTIDGTRWQEVFNGTDNHRYNAKHLEPRELVPNLYHYFVDEGIVVGRDSDMIASGPNHISLPGYLEITRGHPSTDCQTNFCQPKIDRTIFSFFTNPVVFSSWPVIQRTIPKDIKMYSDTGHQGMYRHDHDTIQLTQLFLSWSLPPDFMWVSLGDTDEYGHLNNYSKYIQSLQQADDFIGVLAKRYPQSNIIITVDHGRNSNFTDHGISKDSERVWLMMRGNHIDHLGFVKTEPISLSNIYPTISDLKCNSSSPDSILSKIKK